MDPDLKPPAEENHNAEMNQNLIPTKLLMHVLLLMMSMLKSTPMIVTPLTTKMQSRNMIPMSLVFMRTRRQSIVTKSKKPEF